MMHKTVLFFFFFVFPICHSGSSTILKELNEISEHPDNNIKVAIIYGTDDRRDVISHNIRKKHGTSFYLGTSSLGNLQRSVVVLAKKNPNNSYSRDTKLTDALAKHADGIELCPGETLKFKNQKVSLDVFCSGILIGEKTILTADHCIRKLQKHPPTNTWYHTNRCPSINVLFDYTTKNTNFNKSNIFGCKKIISAGVNDLDYAIIELDRKPEGRSPVSIRHSGGPSSKTLTMIGSPTGLPLKLSPGKIISADNEHFFMNLDSFGGNSGSPVFSYENGEPLLEGILSRGERDFIFSSYSSNSGSSKPVKTKGIQIVDLSTPNAPVQNIVPCFKPHILSDNLGGELILKTTAIEDLTAVPQYEQPKKPTNAVQ